MYWTALVVSLGITGWAVLQQRRGAGMALLGVGACIGALLAFDRQFAYRYFFASFALVVAAVLATLPQRAREQERERQKAELTAQPRCSHPPASVC